MFGGILIAAGGYNIIFLWQAHGRVVTQTKSQDDHIWQYWEYPMELFNARNELPGYALGTVGTHVQLA